MTPEEASLYRLAAKPPAQRRWETTGRSGWLLVKCLSCGWWHSEHELLEKPERIVTAEVIAKGRHWYEHPDGEVEAHWSRYRTERPSSAWSRSFQSFWEAVTTGALTATDNPDGTLTIHATAVLQATATVGAA